MEARILASSKREGSNACAAMPHNNTVMRKAALRIAVPLLPLELTGAYDRAALRAPQPRVAPDDRMKGQFPSLASLLLVTTLSQAQNTAGIVAEVDAVYSQSDTLYLDIHRHPELSFHEQQTAAKLASGLRELGYDVSTGIGRTGVVGVLKNGTGPVVMLRTELDALPVEEKTGLPYASTVRTKD